MRVSLFSCAVLALLGSAGFAQAAPAKVVHTPTPAPALVPVGKDNSKVAKEYADALALPLKIDAVTFVSSWTPCTAMPGFAPGPGGNLEATDAHTVGFCGMASVRLKKTTATANLAGRKVTIQVSSQHYNVTPWTTNVSLYTLPFPASGDTLTYPRVGVGSFPGDRPGPPAAVDSNLRRQMDADYAFHLGRPVLVELRNNGQTIDKRACTFKTTQVTGGTGAATLTCP